MQRPNRLFKNQPIVTLVSSNCIELLIIIVHSLIHYSRCRCYKVTQYILILLIRNFINQVHLTFKIRNLRISQNQFYRKLISQTKTFHVHDKILKPHAISVTLPGEKHLSLFISRKLGDHLVSQIRHLPSSGTARPNPTHLSRVAPAVRSNLSVGTVSRLGCVARGERIAHGALWRAPSPL